ncbi:MAG: hypothetical protein P8P74_12965, partial [Crocinitomicaceae bacterium]|nr:hypothetical protein [Crocinitomicaceae bacterium]
MTLLVSWIGVDSRGPASLYMISDSRISWDKDSWDFGKKVFAFKNSPDIIGYCGDVHFPLQAISQVVNLADNGVIFDDSHSASKKFERIKHKIKELLEPYPKKYMKDSFSIIYGARVSKKEFVCYELSWSKSAKWSDNKVSHVDYSDKVYVLGSGAKEFTTNYEKYQSSEIQRTSRAIYQCFSDTLQNIRDPLWTCNKKMDT